MYVNGVPSQRDMKRHEPQGLQPGKDVSLDTILEGRIVHQGVKQREQLSVRKQPLGHRRALNRKAHAFSVAASSTGVIPSASGSEPRLPSPSLNECALLKDARPGSRHTILGLVRPLASCPLAPR